MIRKLYRVYQKARIWREGPGTTYNVSGTEAKLQMSFHDWSNPVSKSINRLLRNLEQSDKVCGRIKVSEIHQMKPKMATWPNVISNDDEIVSIFREKPLLP